ncbi:hypothetical protein UT300005_22330 [Clostridium sp. CTA-5]
MNKTINVFKALSDETRVKTLLLISKKSMCAKGISKHLNITEAAVSQHIKILKEADLVIGYKIGYHIIYDLNEEILNQIDMFIKKLISNDFSNITLETDIQNTENSERKCIYSCKHKKCSHKGNFKEDLEMKVCFPVKSNEGVNSIPYGHFGTAPLFIVCDTETEEIKVLNNGDLGHEHGKCQPIKALSGEIVDAVVVGGIGQGAITKLNSMGIKVYKSAQGSIKENLEALKKLELVEFSPNHTCNHDGCEH